jgi:hypothetical protein
MFTYGSAAAIIISDNAREKPDVQDRQAGQSKRPMTLQDCEHTQKKWIHRQTLSHPKGGKRPSLMLDFIKT